MRTFRQLLKQDAEADRREGVRTDTYGLPSVSPRHRLCRCAVPCAARFRCTSAKHRGPRDVPWCVGGSDDERCSDCWCKVVLPKLERADRAASGGRGAL